MEIYDEIRVFRQHPEELISMVSEMIATLDHNTIMFMVDEMKAERKKLEADREKLEAELGEKNAEIASLRRKLEENGIV